MALRTNEKSPNVRKVIGKKKKPNTGRKSAFNTPSTSAVTKAVLKSLISMPKGKRAMINKLTVVTNQIKTKCNIALLHAYKSRLKSHFFRSDDFSRSA